jgi:hypothetical protein
VPEIAVCKQCGRLLVDEEPDEAIGVSLIEAENCLAESRNEPCRIHGGQSELRRP